MVESDVCGHGTECKPDKQNKEIKNTFNGFLDKRYVEDTLIIQVFSVDTDNLFHTFKSCSLH